jgi:hypothetical protein
MSNSQSNVGVDNLDDPIEPVLNVDLTFKTKFENLTGFVFSFYSLTNKRITMDVAQAQAEIVRLIDAIDVYPNRLQILLRSDSGISWTDFIKALEEHYLLSRKAGEIREKYQSFLDLIVDAPTRALIETRIGRYACLFYQMFSKNE